MRAWRAACFRRERTRQDSRDTGISVYSSRCSHGKDSYDLVINSMDDYYMYAHDDSQGNVFVPSGTWPVIFGYDEPQNLLLKADSTDTMATVGKLLRRYLTVI